MQTIAQNTPVAVGDIITLEHLDRFGIVTSVHPGRVVAVRPRHIYVELDNNHFGVAIQLRRDTGLEAGYFPRFRIPEKQTRPYTPYIPRSHP